MAATLHSEMEIIANAKRAFNQATELDDSRATFADYVAATSVAHPSDMQVEDLEFPGPEPEQTVPVRWYRPAAAADPSPCVLYFHGGGFCFGDLDSSNMQAWGIAQEAGVHVISVDYRLAPSHQFPAAHEDCFAVLQHVAAHGATMGIDTTRLCTWGDSAGGNLSAAICIMSRDRNGPAISAQVVVTPMLSDDYESPSYIEHADSPGLAAPIVRSCWLKYLGGDQSPDAPHAMPLKAADLSGLPPALLLIAEIDPLADDGRRYAERLGAAGVETEVRIARGMVHGFLRARLLGPDTAAEFDVGCRFVARRLGVEG